MVGVGTALHLLERGHDVLLLDRKTPGRETSYGNAGLIQREAVEPYPLPRETGELFQHAFGLSAAVSYHWRAMPTLIPRLAAYWYASSCAYCKRMVYPDCARHQRACRLDFSGRRSGSRQTHRLSAGFQPRRKLCQGAGKSQTLPRYLWRTVSGTGFRRPECSRTGTDQTFCRQRALD